MKQKDIGEDSFDWSIVKECSREPESPTLTNEGHRPRVGLKPSKTVEMIGKNFIFFSDLTLDIDKEATVKYFVEVYLDKKDSEKVLEVDSENLMEKHFLKIKLPERSDCHEFKAKYEKTPFKDKTPRISVFLGKD